MKRTIVQRVSLGNSNQALIISHIGFDEDGFGSEQIQGIMPIRPDSDGPEMLEKAAKHLWKLSGTPNRLNNFVPTVTKGPKLTEEQLATMTHKQNSISVEIEIGEDENVLRPEAEKELTQAK